MPFDDAKGRLRRARNAHAVILARSDFSSCEAT